MREGMWRGDTGTGELRERGDLGRGEEGFERNGGKERKKKKRGKGEEMEGVRSKGRYACRKVWGRCVPLPTPGTKNVGR